MSKTKVCNICKESFSLDMFYLSKNGSYNFCCIPCDKKRKVVYRSENKEKIALQELKWVPECTREEIYAELMLYIQDNGRNCEYCKKPWTYKRIFSKERRPKIETNFSIDRLDSTKTYVLDNLVFCCVGCNLRKNQVRLSDIVNIIRVWKNRKDNKDEFKME